MEFFIKKIQVVSAERKYQRARTGNCTLVGPPTKDGHVPSLKMPKYVFSSKCVSGTRVSRLPKFGIKAENVVGRDPEKNENIGSNRKMLC